MMKSSTPIMSRRSFVAASAATAAVAAVALNGCSGGEGGGGGSAASGPIEDELTIAGGPIKGFSREGDTGLLLHSYFAIPYAEPPVGELRWKAPQPKAPWTDPIDCTNFSIISPQYGVGLPDILTSQPQSEDCLYLNVTTPAQDAGEKLPVLVWLHGGGLLYGNGNDVINSNTRLPEAENVVSVAVNMRLGATGLLCASMLSADSEDGVSGNYMILDMIAALEWVRDNIAFFGGDPDNVTIIGQSGGGWKIMSLIASPKAAGLFKRGVLLSGMEPVLGAPMAELEKQGDAFFNALGITTVEEARAIPMEDLLAAANNVDIGNGVLTGAATGSNLTFAVDGVVLPKECAEAMASGDCNKVPAIVCMCGNEFIMMTTLVAGNAAGVANITNYGEDAYAIVFDRTPDGWASVGGAAMHTIDVPYWYGDWDNTTGFWPVIWNLENIFFQVPESAMDPGLSAVDEDVSRAMMAMLGKFVRGEAPATEGVEWPAWNAGEDNYLYVGKDGSFSMDNGFSTFEPK